MQKSVHGITVAHFFETYREKLKLELLVGAEGLHRLILEGTVNRPALALTGFFKYFAHKRIQMFGAAEMTYLKTLSHPRQVEVLEQMVRREKRIDLVVTLREWTPEVIEERTGLEVNHYRVLGMDVAHIELYVRPGRDIARLVEVAALTHALKLMGHDPAKDFNDRLIAFMRDQARQPAPTRIKPVVRPRDGA